MDTWRVFVLAKDVEFIPTDAVAEQTKNGFDYEAGDVVITQLNSRNGSKIISRDLALILQEFRSPKSLAEVIYTFSESQDKDPLQVADEVFSSLANMQQCGILIPGHLQDETLKQGLLPTKENFRAYTIQEKYRQFDDTEVYRVKDGSGNMFALKLLTANKSSFQELFENETAILQLLDNTCNPKLIEHGKENDLLFLITEWCGTITCEQEANRNRNINARDNFINLLNLAVSIIGAYNHLHKQKVLHGDVHPDNVFITPTGGVKIIDYGYGSFVNNGVKTQRGGTGFYYEPEFAAAALQGIPHPPVTEKGEQYSIAVLLYYLVSGHHYLNFSFEREKLFGQIVNEAPLSFSNYDLQCPAELDHVMAKALSKDPEERFSSLEEFARALIKIRDAVFESNRFYIFDKQNPEEKLVRFLIQKFGWDSPFIEKGFSMAPVCSVNYGAAGIAYMFHRLSCVYHDPSLADLADVWANRASLFHHNYDKSFYSAKLEITEKIVGKRSLYHSPTGVYLTQALISNSKGDMHALSKGGREFLSAAGEPCNKIDLALGKSGLLVGCSLLYRELKGLKGDAANDITLFAELIKNEIWNELNEYAEIYRTNPIDYFGIAHGWGGLLYATLLWCSTANCSLPANFMKRVDELLSCSVENKTSIYWQLSTKHKNVWTGWCNGSAGHIFLSLLLYKHFKDEKFIVVAEKLGYHLMTDAKTSNSDLCCGMAGNAYAMIGLYKATNENIYLQEMKRIKQEMLKKWPSQPGRNNSLYKGEVGIGVLLSEMNNLELARMPLFE